MMANKNLRTAFLLMALSILLLVVFQAYWLRDAYADEHRKLRREVGVILRETLVREQMQDFMFKRSSLSMDSIGKLMSTMAKRQNAKAGTIFIDSIRSASSFSIMVSGDSVRPQRQRFMNFDNERNGGEHNTESNIVIGIPMPSGMIQLDSIRAGFHKSLLDAGITLAFTLQKVPFDSAGTRGRRGEVRLATSQGPDTPKMVQRINMETIEARSENVFLFILQKISLQLVFAVVMLAVIVAAFVFLYRNLRQQHRLAEIKNDLIANITHELKTPIATVSVAIEALKNFNAMHDTLRTKEYLDISGLELQRLNLLVDKVLKLSMFEQDKMELREETVDMKAVVGEVVDSMRLQLEKRGATVSTEYDGESFYVKGDRTHLQSVLYNLLDNAIKYTGRKPEIKIHLADKAGRLLLRVSDNGIGIAPQHQPKIFEKFFRVPHGNTHNIKGYGLGLSYVAEVVRLHGGKISVESEEGKGSTFSVWIG